jgi:hypothetical protein
MHPSSLWTTKMRASNITIWRTSSWMTMIRTTTTAAVVGGEAGVEDEDEAAAVEAPDHAEGAEVAVGAVDGVHSLPRARRTSTTSVRTLVVAVPPSEAAAVTS